MLRVSIGARFSIRSAFRPGPLVAVAGHCQIRMMSKRVAEAQGCRRGHRERYQPVCENHYARWGQRVPRCLLVKFTQLLGEVRCYLLRATTALTAPPNRWSGHEVHRPHDHDRRALSEVRHAATPFPPLRCRSRLQKTSSMGQRLRVTPLAQHLFDLGDVQFLVADHLTSQLFERHAATLGQSE